MIQLIPYGFSEVAYEAVVKGNSVEYSIDNVAPGVYTLKVMKEGHRGYEAKIVVTGDVVRDVTLSLLPTGDFSQGDINLDGGVNSVDSNLLRRIVASAYSVEAGSDAALAADLNGDGQINSIDSNLLKRKVAGQ